MLQILTAITLSAIINSCIAIALISSVFFLMLRMGVKATKEDLERQEYPFDEKDLYQ